jgi:hypothetical protein
MFDNLEHLNVYREMMTQAAQGRIAAVIPLKNIDGTPISFVVSSDPTQDPDFAPSHWVQDPTDYSAMAADGNYFGVDGIGVKYAMAMIHFAHHYAQENGFHDLYKGASDDQGQE